MAKIELIRHAQSLFNKYGISERDCGITNEGREQAATVTGHYDLVICSPLRRCKETLAESKVTYDELRIVDLCRERRGSQCDFLYKEEAEKETEAEALQRTQELKEYLREVRKEYNSILVVSHCCFIWLLTSYINEKGDRIGWRLENCQKMTFHLN
jgi:broad specificity phosphatase PhoE